MLFIVTLPAFDGLLYRKRARNLDVDRGLLIHTWFSYDIGTRSDLYPSTATLKYPTNKAKHLRIGLCDRNKWENSC